MEIIKFEPRRCATGNCVYFTVNWEFLWIPSGQKVKTSANVRKVIQDNKIKEKYHMVNFQDVTGCSIRGAGMKKINVNNTLIYNFYYIILNIVI